jgi:hypothetical protein
MSRAAAFGQFFSFSQGQMGVGERQAGNRLFDALVQSVAIVFQGHFDMGGPQEFQVAIETANIQMKSTDQGATRLRTGAEELEQAINSRGSFRSHRFEGARRNPFRASAGPWLPGHAFLGAPILFEE